MLEFAREYGAGIRLVIAQGDEDNLTGLPTEAPDPHPGIRPAPAAGVQAQDAGHLSRLFLR